MKAVLLAAIPVLFAAGTAQAGLLNSWENSLEGFATIRTHTFSDTIGVTDGTYSLAYSPTGYDNSFRSAYTPAIREALTGQDHLHLDLTTVAAIPNWAHFEVKPHITIEGAGGNYTLAAVRLQDATTGVPAGLHQLQWEIPQNFKDGIAAGTGFGHIFFEFTNGGSTQATVYLDNLRTSVVPEPASLALLGLGGLAMGRRRRA